MDYLKALLVNGRVVTGVHHGEAYSKLSDDEKESASIVSGFWNRQSGRFLTDGNLFYTKQFVLIRHSLIDSSEYDPGLSQRGHRRADSMAESLTHLIDLTGFKGFMSPYRRCLETAFHVARHTGVSFQVDRRLSEAYCYPYHNESPEELFARLEDALNFFPDRSLLVTHCNYIGKLTEFICGSEALRQEPVIPPASITYIHFNQLVFFGKSSYPSVKTESM